MARKHVLGEAGNLPAASDAWNLLKETIIQIERIKKLLRFLKTELKKYDLKDEKYQNLITIIDYAGRIFEDELEYIPIDLYNETILEEENENPYSEDILSGDTELLPKITDILNRCKRTTLFLDGGEEPGSDDYFGKAYRAINKFNKPKLQQSRRSARQSSSVGGRYNRTANLRRPSKKAGNSKRRPK